MKTPEGKAVSKMNAYKHGGRSAGVREFARTMTKWKDELTQFLKFIKYTPK